MGCVLKKLKGLANSLQGCAATQQIWTDWRAGYERSCPFLVFSNETTSEILCPDLGESPVEHYRDD